LSWNLIHPHGQSFVGISQDWRQSPNRFGSLRKVKFDADHVPCIDSAIPPKSPQLSRSELTLQEGFTPVPKIDRCLWKQSYFLNGRQKLCGRIEPAKLAESGNVNPLKNRIRCISELFCQPLQKEKKQGAKSAHPNQGTERVAEDTW
jgi:hypothetical protein